MVKYFILLFCLILSNPLPVLAQINDSGFVQNATIVLKPAYPEPQSTFSASLDDYSISGQKTSVSWKINGKTIVSNNNLRTITLESGAAGEQITIEAIIGLNGQQSLNLSKTITPFYLDIIVEPQTRTPAFYLGRGLPSIGSQVNLRAIMSGTNLSPKDLIYSWQINDKFVEGGPIRGRSNTSITVPRGNFFLVNLRVTNLTGGELIKKTLQLPSVNPELYFYEKSSLYGINSKVLTSLYLTGNSATITGEPYHLALGTYNQPSLLEWTVDNKKSDPSTNNPYEITLARPTSESSGRSQINLHVRNLTQLIQGVRGNLQVNF